MPTTAERRALWFFAGVITLGGGARAVEASRAERRVTGGEPALLTQQLATVDSARAHRGRGRRPPPRDSGAAPGDNFRRSRAAQPQAQFAPSYIAPPVVPTHVPPSYGPAAPAPPNSRMGAALQGPKRWFQAHPLDVDVAGAADLEALPGVGPALARRIVAERDAQGPFGSLQGLQRVRGIGAALAGRLKSLVVFSGVPLPSARPPGKAPSRGRHRASRG